MKSLVEICLQCGVCCVINEYLCHAQYDNQFSPKYTYVYDCLGSANPQKNCNIWLCVSCHKCEEICPYDVSPIHFIESIKKLAFENGFAHPLISGEVDQIVKTGYAFPLTSASSRQRERLELEPMEIVSAAELEKLAVRTGLLEVLKKYRGGTY